MWLLTHRHCCRIFQDTSVPDIIKKVLDDAAIPSDQYKISVQNQHQPREFCVQYRESELNFISRLMEEEGIFYFFEHTADKHILIIGDSPAANQTIVPPDKVIFHEPSGGVPPEEYISEYRYSRELRPGKTILRDFNFMKPKLNMEVMETNSGDGKGLEVLPHR